MKKQNPHYYTPSEKLDFIIQYNKSRKTIIRFCEENNICRITFYKWLSKYRKAIQNNINDDLIFDTNKRKPKLKFSNLGIEKGSILTLKGNNSIKCTVYNDNKVIYKGKIYSLTGLADKLIKHSGNISGPKHFCYKGIVLNKIKGDF